MHSVIKHQSGNKHALEDNDKQSGSDTVINLKCGGDAK
jgi:hypothetical protein